MLDLDKQTEIRLTITSVNGFSGAVDLLIPGFDPESGSITLDPPSPVTVPADGSVEVAALFKTEITSLAGTQNLTIGATPEDTTVDPQSVDVTYTVNNLLEIPIMDGAGAVGANHDWLVAQVGDTLTLRPGTGVIWTNYDTTSTHVIHGNSPLDHAPGNCQPGDASMASPTVAGQAGGSWGLNDTVGNYYDPDTGVVTGEVTPYVVVGGGFHCHCQGHTTGDITIGFDNALTPQPALQQ